MNRYAQSFERITGKPVGKYEALGSG